MEDYIETLRNVHNTFGLPYPAVSQQSLSAPLSPKSDTRHGRYNLSWSIIVSHATICDDTNTAACETKSVFNSSSDFCCHEAMRIFKRSAFV